jgi:hypothetical protein
LASSGPAESATTTTTDDNNNNNDNDSQILSFAEIKELIETGRLDEIPNNKLIPDTLNVRHILPLRLILTPIKLT